MTPRPGPYNGGRIVVTDVIGGHAHETVIGTCDQDVGQSEISALFSHEYFGGRWGEFGDGKFKFKRHTD